MNNTCEECLNSMPIFDDDGLRYYCSYRGFLEEATKKDKRLTCWAFFDGGVK